MDRFKAANKASILGMTGNIFLFIIKLIVGFITLFRVMETIQDHERKHSQRS